VTKLAYQDIDTTSLGLTKQECSEQVHIEIQGQVIAGAAAVAYLLKARGNKKMATLIFRSGPLAQIEYHWVATHRSSWLIKIATKNLERKVPRI
jgi:predicted DCC family thiol-disulfide oxidoreductase YuxK